MFRKYFRVAKLYIQATSQQIFSVYIPSTTIIFTATTIIFCYFCAMRTTIAIILLLFISSACRRQASIDGPWKWEPLTPEADSITRVIEWILADETADHDISPQVDELGRLTAKANPGTRDALLTRWHFWRGIVFQHNFMRDSFIYEFKLAGETADSARRPYEFHRIRTRSQWEREEQGVDMLKPLLTDLDFYMQRGDSCMAAQCAMMAASSLSAADQDKLAMKYYSLGDSLLIRCGMESTRKIYKINLVTMLFNTGDSVTADSLMVDLLADRDVARHPTYSNVLLRNAFLRTDDVAYLRRAYMQLDGMRGAKGLRAFYESLLAGYYTDKSDGEDSAAHYTELTLTHLSDITNLYHKAAAYQVLARRFHSTGDYRKSHNYLQRYIATYDSAEMRRNPARVLRVQTERELEIMRLEKDAARRDSQLIWLAALLLLAIAGGFGCFFYMHRRQRLIMEKDAALLEVEKMRRRVSAAALAVEENTAMSEAIESAVATLRDDGKLGDEAMRAVSGVMSQHRRKNQELGNITEMFESTHPHFVANLKRACPGIGDTQIKLASFIIMEMSNRQIALFLNIRQESVRQAKWRLRARLGIAEGESLEEALQALNHA